MARAARELTALVASDPETALARTNLGLLRLQQGQTAAAVRELEEALRLAPGLRVAEEALAAAGSRE